MRYELKITLPIYKILYSLAFMVIIVLVSFWLDKPRRKK